MSRATHVSPRREHCFLVPSVERDALLLGEFQRAFAVFWLQTHGRSFGSNAKVRKDVGVVSKRHLGQQTDVALWRGVWSCYAQYEYLKKSFPAFARSIAESIAESLAYTHSILSPLRAACSAPTGANLFGSASDSFA